MKKQALQYNNMLGSGWVYWDSYKIRYAEVHGSSKFIENYPTERPTMFRIIDEDGNIIIDEKEQRKLALVDKVIKVMLSKKKNPMTVDAWDDNQLYNELAMQKDIILNEPFAFSEYTLMFTYESGGGIGMGEYPAQFTAFLLADLKEL